MGWENVVDSTRFDRSEKIRVICYRVIIAEDDSRELKQIWRIWAVMGELKKLSILLVPIESRWVICVEINIVKHGDASTGHFFKL